MEHLNPAPSPAEPLRFFPAGATVAVLTAEGLDRLLDYRAPAGGARAGRPRRGAARAAARPRAWSGAKARATSTRSKLRDVARVLDAPPIAPAMRGFLARAADYTLTPLSIMLRLATRAPGLGAPPAARPLLRLTGAAPERMTPARARVLAAFADYGNLGFAPDRAGAARRGLARRRRRARGAGRARARGGAARRALSAPRSRRRRRGRCRRAQAEAAARLRAAVAAGRYSTTLLKGVTGSGKTEVYLEAVAEALRRGRQALVLLPEIALSVEFLDRVEARFGARPAEWHSGVTQAARRRAWLAVATGDARLVVGARSALFLPFAELGLVVVDEEHDGSYKQEDGACYHARDMAVLRASIEGAAVVLASATPSLESWANAAAGKYARLDLPERFGVAELPEMRAIDLRADPPEPGRWISEPLAAAVDRAPRRRRAGAPVPQPPRLRAADHLPRLRPPGRLRRLRRAHGRAPLPQAAGLPPVRRDQADPHRLPGLQGRGPDDRARPRRRAPRRGGRGALARRPPRDPLLGPRRRPAGAQGPDRGDRRRRRRPRHRHPARLQGPQLPAPHARRGHRRRPRAAGRRPARRREDLPADPPGRRPRRPRRAARASRWCRPTSPSIRRSARSSPATTRASGAPRPRPAAARSMPPYGRLAGVVVSGTDEPRTWEVARALARASGPLRAAGAELFGPAPAPIARVRGRHRLRLLVRAAKGVALQPALRAWVGGGALPGERAGQRSTSTRRASSRTGGGRWRRRIHSRRRFRRAVDDTACTTSSHGQRLPGAGAKAPAGAGRRCPCLTHGRE